MSRRLFVPVVALFALAASGCDEESSGPTQVRENAFVWSGAGTPGAALVVKDFSGDINVSPSTDDTVRVTAKLEWRGAPDAVDKDVHFTGARLANDILICAVWGDGKCTRGDYTANVKRRSGLRVKVHFTVQVPAGMRLELSNISGDIAAAASAPVKATTMNGDVRVVTAVGPVKGETLNGSVDIRMSSLAAGSDSVVAKTLNGEALIYLPAVSDAEVDLSVGNGTASSMFPENAAIGSGRKIQFTAGTGARAIVAHALNGEVALRKLDAQGRAP